MAEDNLPERRNPLFDNWGDDNSLDVLGANLLRTGKYGDFSDIGARAYDDALGSDKANEIRDGLYEEEKKLYDETGVYGVPERASNSRVSASIIQVMQESALGAGLGDLEKLVKDHRCREIRSKVTLREDIEKCCVE